MTVKSIREIYLETGGKAPSADPQSIQAAVEEALSEPDPEWMDENSAYFRNYRVNSAMEGNLVAGPSEIADEIIELLRSDYEISREVRDELAEAFLRGRGGMRPRESDPDDVRPYIAVAGGGDRARLSKAVLIRRKWFDAAELLDQKKLNGQKGDEVMHSVGKDYGLNYETMKKAKTFYNKFLIEFQDNESALCKSMRESGMDSEKYKNLQLHAEWKDVARSFYIEREAAAVVGADFEQFGG